MKHATDIDATISALKAKGEPFAVATVVRTVAATAAKAGAKAIIGADGSLSQGWIGGGCARAAVVQAAREALQDGAVRLVSVQPPDVLQAQGLEGGEERQGVRFATNMCPSEGTMDIFVEPIMPRPEIVIYGASPVAAALADLARRLGYQLTICAPASERAAFEAVERWIEGYDRLPEREGPRYIVVSTQGRGDEAALQAALAGDASYVAFVGSRKKAAALRAKLADAGVDPERLARLKAPAGFDLGAITPEEIALSILSEIVACRRKAQPR